MISLASSFLYWILISCNYTPVCAIDKQQTLAKGMAQSDKESTLLTEANNRLEIFEHSRIIYIVHILLYFVAVFVPACFNLSGLPQLPVAHFTNMVLL